MEYTIIQQQWIYALFDIFNWIFTSNINKVWCRIVYNWCGIVFLILENHLVCNTFTAIVCLKLVTMAENIMICVYSFINLLNCKMFVLFLQAFCLQDWFIACTSFTNILNSIDQHPLTWWCNFPRIF